MIGLVYRRPYCTADFTILSDDIIMLINYRKMYGNMCHMIEIDDELLAQTAGAVEGTLLAIHKKIMSETGSGICTVFYYKERKRKNVFLMAHSPFLPSL